MLWIETGIAPPNEALLKEAQEENSKVIHLQALTVKPLHAVVNLSFFDAVVIASPRAAEYSFEYLKEYNRLQVIAVGKGTANALKEHCITVHFCGDSLGAENILNFIQNKFQKIAWISAKETAVDLQQKAIELHLDITHIPVYETFFTEFSKEDLNKIEHPCRWILRSKKGVQSVCKYFKQNDSFKAIGKSALEEMEKQFKKLR